MQSLMNLVSFLKPEIVFYTISLNRDIDHQPLDKVLSKDRWNVGPNGENIFITSSISPSLILTKLREVRPHTIFVNGIFHWHTSFFGLVIGRMMGIRTVISPRGMLQDWALRRHWLKKRIYLGVFRVGVGSRQEWHATDSREKDEILKVFGPFQKVHVAPNIPRRPVQPKALEFPEVTGKIRLVFLSLISPNKNLHLIIQAVNGLGGRFMLDIYGPIADEEYWSQCDALISEKAEVSYKGAIPPWNVPNILQQYHFFVLPTQGENFGHAIFDAFASGTPVIISRTTPWKNVTEDNLGFYTDIDGSDDLCSQLETVSNLSDSTYSEMRVNATRFAEQYWASKDYVKEYGFLFQ